MRLYFMAIFNLFAFGIQIFSPLFAPGVTSSTIQYQVKSDQNPFKVFLPVIRIPAKVYLPLITYTLPPSVLKINYRSGQTFILWPERTDLQGETYRVYRSNQPINPYNLGQATLLGEVGKDSTRFYTNRQINLDNPSHTWQDRFVDRYIIDDFGPQLPPGTGMMVWTLGPQDFGGAASGNGFYAVTVRPAGGNETLDLPYISGPVAEAVADPLPVEIHSTTDLGLSSGAHIFIQYMDLRSWNPTFHAPNATNGYYGLSPSDPGITSDLQYAYDYIIYVPSPSACYNRMPANLPVMLFLHGHRGNAYHWNLTNPDNFCAYVIMPQDETDTWYFGFAHHHDYRSGSNVSAGDTIVNYTEQRVLRMVYDLIRKPIGPAVDMQRIYVEGQSMGGSGALAFAERYPNVFAAAYASQPMTNYLTAGVTNTDWVADGSVKWGAPALNLPINQDAPDGWAAPLQKYNGVGVWDWQNYQVAASGTKLHDRLYDDMAPVGIIHATNDPVILWSTQGQPTYTSFDAGHRVWGGKNTFEQVNEHNPSPHQWMYYFGLPPSLAPINGTNKYTWVPFWGLQVIRNETEPGLSNLSGNNPGAPWGYYNETILWSSSWNHWDGSPIDQPGLWQISLCATRFESANCGGGVDQTVDVTPRRLQHFVLKPGGQYTWENRRVSDNALVASGTVTADNHGLIIIPSFSVSTDGSRLILKPKV